MYAMYANATSTIQYEGKVQYHKASKLKIESLHMSQVAHQAEAYPGFCSIKRLGYFYSPLDGMLVHRRATPSIKFIHLGGERHCES